MEASSWKQQLAVASLIAVLLGYVVRLLASEFTISAPGLGAGNVLGIALFAVLAGFFLPLLWWRTALGYIGGVIIGIIVVAGQSAAVGPSVAAVPETLIIIIPHYVFGLLLIGSSVLAWREG